MFTMNKDFIRLSIINRPAGRKMPVSYVKEKLFVFSLFYVDVLHDKL